MFCYAWGAIIGGPNLAARCSLVGFLSLLLAAVLIIAIVFMLSQFWGDEPVFALAMVIGGTTVGAGLGLGLESKRIALVSAGVGAAAWFLASLITVSPFPVGTAAGPAAFLGMLYTPGIGLTFWGLAMGSWLVPCPASRVPAGESPFASNIASENQS
jgi:hypothetical protein